MGLALSSLSNAMIDNTDAAAVFATKLPSGSSIRIPEHLAQLFENNRFQDYDFGPEENMVRYGNDTPPLFDVSEISGIPVALFIAGMDTLEGPLDNQWLATQLEDVLVYNTVYSNYSHFDFYLAENPEDYLNDIIDLLSEYNNP